jgi:V/A-type H+-transporting ATPase subunit I
VAACGVTSIIFGVLYGSYLGIEDAIKPLWIQPKNNIMTILIITILAGVVLLSLGLIIGIFNAWRARDWPNFYFANNGLAGLLLYWSILGLGAGIALIKNPAFTTVFIVLAVISGITIMFSDVFKRLVANEHPLIEGGIGIYAIQAIFELFESLISFLSNSLSYVRVGAFAVAHGFLSGVIFTMADLVSPAGHNILWFLVVAFGTVFLVGFEGLIVGIQTMRLEYYEFFSKFFKGGGLKYEPLLVNTTTEK